MAEDERDAASQGSADRRVDVIGAVIIVIALVLGVVFYFTG